jgi:uncharacterized protein (TIGR00730 family)
MTKKPILAYNNDNFMNTHEARPLRILSEYLEPEKRLREANIHHTMVFYGSARLQEDNPHYIACEEFSYQCARYSQELEKEFGQSVTVCTGGGPGIMEAANRGASRANDQTIGYNIMLPFEQHSNKYISDHLNFEFHYFFTRKLWFLYHAKALIAFPGGFGTLDELFETLTLIQTEKLAKGNLPILLYGRKHWEKLINFQFMVDEGLISQDDLNLFHYFDSPEEGMEIIKPKLYDILSRYSGDPHNQY